jgi:hypothetical protein
LASSILKGEALLSLPVTLPYSAHPLFLDSSLSNSFSKGPPPTLVTYDLKTTSTSSTCLGPIPTSAHMEEAVTSFEVTKGYPP